MLNDLTELNEVLDEVLEFERIPLGRTPDMGCCSRPLSEEERVIYPNLWISRLDKAFKGEDEGKAVIEYRVENRSSQMRKGKPEKHSVDMKVLAIEPIRGKKKVSFKETSFESLDAQLDSALTEFADRKRDGGGRYAAGQSGAGVDDFRAAHGTGKRKLLKRVAGVAALAGAGAVAGTRAGRGAAMRAGAGIVRAVKRPVV